MKWFFQIKWQRSFPCLFFPAVCLRCICTVSYCELLLWTKPSIMTHLSHQINIFKRKHPLPLPQASAPCDRLCIFINGQLETASITFKCVLKNTEIDDPQIYLNKSHWKCCQSSFDDMVTPLVSHLIMTEWKHKYYKNKCN